MRILVADDHPLYLNAVQVLLERGIEQTSLEVAHSLNQVMALIDNNPTYDLLLLDYAMPGMNGANGVGVVVKAAGSAPVVIMSGVAHPTEISACITAGARGFLPKTLEGKIFTSALNVVLNGGSYLPVEMHQFLFATPARTIDAPATPPAAATDAPLHQDDDDDGIDGRGFTDRERAIMSMVVDGLSNKEIARLLNLREVTIKVQLTRIYKKLGAKNRAQAATIMAQTHVLA